MLGYVIARPRKKGEGDLEIPDDIRRRLRAWVDVDQVGVDGFWLWLRAIIPLLPTPGPTGKGPELASGTLPEDLRDMHRRLVVYAREHARLTVMCTEYTRENVTLSRRLKALEAALRTLEMAGARIEIPPDEEAAEISSRFLPPRRRGGRPRLPVGHLLLDPLSDRIVRKDRKNDPR